MTRATHIEAADRPLPVTIQIELAIRDAIVAGAKPSSPSHELARRDDGPIELVAGARLDRDIVVRRPGAAAQPGLSLALAHLAAAARSTSCAITAWHDLDAAARQRAFVSRASRPLAAALDPEGQSTTARAVLQKIVSTRTR